MLANRLVGCIIVILGLIFIPNLACASQPSQPSTPATSLPPVASSQVIPAVPTLNQPANGSTISGLSVKLEWSPSPGATSYGLQVATDPAFTKLVVDKTEITSASYELTSGLDWKTDYYWHVNATNASGMSPWSENWKFTTPVFQLGKIVFMSGLDSTGKVPQIYIMDVDGGNWKRLTNNMGGDWWPEWSPDGTKIAFNSVRDGNHEVYIMNTDGSNQINLTNNPAADGQPTWSPDSSKIAFNSDRDGDFEIFVMNTDGSNLVKLTSNAGILDSDSSWSPDGSKIAFKSNRDGNLEIYVMNADGTSQIRVTNNSARDIYPAWSPDSTKIAFMSDRDGNYEIYVMNADGSNQTRLTNNPAGDRWPAWSPDGAKITFESGRDCKSDNIGEVYIMNADGSNQTRITSNCANNGVPSWR